MGMKTERRPGSPRTGKPAEWISLTCPAPFWFVRMLVGGFLDSSSTRAKSWNLGLPNLQKKRPDQLKLWSFCGVGSPLTLRYPESWPYYSARSQQEGGLPAWPSLLQSTLKTQTHIQVARSKDSHLARGI